MVNTSAIDPKMQLFWSSLEAGGLEQLPIAIDYLLDLNGCEETPLVKSLRWMQRKKRWPRKLVNWWWNKQSTKLGEVSKNNCTPEEIDQFYYSKIPNEVHSLMLYRCFGDFDKAIEALAVALEKAGVI